MDTVERLVREFGADGLETTITVGAKQYRVFAYTSPGRKGVRVRWNLYEIEGAGERRLRGLTFGVAEGVREALGEIVAAAEQHARTGASARPGARTFRPSPLD